MRHQRILRRESLLEQYTTDSDTAGVVRYLASTSFFTDD